MAAHPRGLLIGSDAVTYHGDDLDRYLSEFDASLEGMGVSPETRLDLVDRVRTFALGDGPHLGPATLSLLLDVGAIREGYERRKGNHAGADYIARCTTGLTLFAQLPPDLQKLAGRPSM